MKVEKIMKITVKTLDGLSFEIEDTDAVTVRSALLSVFNLYPL